MDDALPSEDGDSSAIEAIVRSSRHMPETGPHLAAALLCERVITESDGVLSIIRVVDRVTQTASGTDPPETMPPLSIDNLSMVLSLKPDKARGRFQLRLVMNEPSMKTEGLRDDIISSPVTSASTSLPRSSCG